MRRAHPALDIIQKNCWRINDMAISFLNYSRGNAEDFLPQNLNGIIEDTLHLIQHQLKVWGPMSRLHLI